ncbi:MAG: hypothetical protein ABW250_27550 [Pyrinomonadaceae bacterium]
MNAARVKLFTRTLLLASLALLAARVSHAQESFDVRDALRDYELKVRVADCGQEEHVCAGPAQVQIFKKGAATPTQTLSLPGVEIYRETVAHNPETNPKPRGLYAEEYSFVGEDFNFDGLEDLAVCNGRNGGYGGPSYDVFLFDRGSRRFVASPRLSELTEGPYLGLFFADPKKRRLTAHSKSGCCYHETAVFRVVNNRPVLVEQVVEDATHSAGAGDGFVLVTTKKRVRGRWVVSRKRQRLSR